MTYMECVLGFISKKPYRIPIYSNEIAGLLMECFVMEEKEAGAAAAVCVKRIMDQGLIPELRCYQKGIYFLAKQTVFGELGIDHNQLIEDKYIVPDIGYDTGYWLLHRMGLTTQLPATRTIATNKAVKRARVDKKLEVTICPPKTTVTEQNREYLRTLDVLDMLKDAPIDADDPYLIIADFIRRQKLRYDILLATADRYYGKNAVLELAHTAGRGGIAI